MKKILTLLVMFLMTGGVLMAQSFSYQAVLRDSQNHLVTGKSGTATFTVGNTVLAQDLTFSTNQNGLVSLLLENNNDVDWSNAEIKATFTFNDEQIPAIEVTTPVTAVPYALHADNVKLTTDAIEKYFDNGDDDFETNGEDWGAIYTALKANPGHGNLRDSLGEYIKANKDLAKDIVLSYLKQVSDTDLREAYDTALSMNDNVKDAFYAAVKDFLKNHRQLFVDVAENFIKTATKEEVEALYKNLKSSNAALETERILKRYFKQYLIDSNYICDGTSLCDVIALLNATVECPNISAGDVVVSVDETKWTFSITNSSIPANTTVRAVFLYDNGTLNGGYAEATYQVSSGTIYEVPFPDGLEHAYTENYYCIKVMMPGCQPKTFGNADVCAYAGD